MGQLIWQRFFPAMAILRHHLAIDGRRVTITNNPVCCNDLTSGGFHTCHLATSAHNFGDISIEHQRDAMAFHQLPQGLYKRACSTHRKEHTPFAFQIMDQRIDRGCVKGIAAH